MKKIILFLFLLPIIFVGCKKDGPRLEPSSSMEETEKLLSSAAGSSVIELIWAYSEWELVTNGDGFLYNFTFLKGGNAKQTGKSRISFNYNENKTGELRYQEVTIKNKTTSQSHVIKISQSPEPPIELSINSSIKYQNVTGFGGMNNVWAAGFLSLDEVQKMYSQDGLGYNMMRIMIWPNKNDWGRDVATTLKAQSLGARILASPWTPPSEMKSSNSNLHGHLLPEKYPDYVKHLNDFIAFMKDKGITIEAVSIQNEPDWSPEYDGCEWSPEQILDFVKNHAAAINAKVLAAEAVNFKKMYTDPVLNDPIAVNNLDVVGGHLYGGGLVDYPLARAKGKEIWMTEHLLNDVNDGMGWDQALVLAKELNDCMEANFNAYFWWYLKRSYSMLGDGDKGTVMGETMKRGYVLSHYAKYATGRTRINVGKISGNSNFHVTAYEGTEDITLVVQNLGENSMPSVQFNLANVMSGVEATETTSSVAMTNKAVTLSADKKSIVLSFKPKSIVSVKIKK
jgi:glucuronoarabinoxylan endo-1,4-beta-xylanase